MEPSKDDFCHPYQPYDIQLQFMTNLYQCIEKGGVGIFESPTGTGKSLSLICGALTWLRDHKRRTIEQAVGQVEDDGEPAWLLEAEKKARRRDLLQHHHDLEQRLRSVRRQETGQKNKSARAKPQQKRLRVDSTSNPPTEDDNDDAFLLDDYDSGDEQVSAAYKSIQGLSANTTNLLEKLIGGRQPDEEESPRDEVRIIFCSRTHSQLSQFVSELRRVKLPASMSLDDAHVSSASAAGEEPVRHLSLGSRKNLCINPKVSRIGSASAINERCLELQKPGTSQEHRCKFLPSKDTRNLVETFRDRAVATIRDIEDLASLGRNMEICPYYASRAAITYTEILTLPYPLLLQKSAREALGVSLKNNIVIIDEAHNLIDAIADSYSASMSLSQLDLATSQLTTYVQRFRNRLKGSNRVYVTQIIRLLNSISDCLRETAAKNRQNEVELLPAQLMAGKGVDQIRSHKLVQYLQESKLAQKVEGYVESKQNVLNKEDIAPREKGALMHLQGFLLILMNPSTEGRLFFSRNDQELSVRYLLLDPREHFRDIVEDARTVVLAGGTMSPMADYTHYLFSYLPNDILSTCSFGHVIPPENLFVQPISVGPSGIDFDFTFENRRSESMITELGHLISSVCQIVPDGVVVFFPSYDYLGQVLSVWRQATTGLSVMNRLESVKRVFEEVRGSLSSESLLREYSSSIDGGSGGLLLSVVGGKLSEGINFSDRLGRAVLAVGLPFPNSQSAVWKAKMEHVEKTYFERQSKTGEVSEQDRRAGAKAAGRDFYENACMRAVNQCIGRAIRHKNDYASIMLVDKRYCSQRIQKKLPLWIRNSMEGGRERPPLAEVKKGLAKFFEMKR